MRRSWLSLPAGLILTLISLLASGAAAAPAATPRFQLIWQSHFGVSAPLGSFGGCTVKPVCTALPASLRSQWWAYPAPWPDTATQRHYPVGGFYCPRLTVWISDGEMHIRMFRRGNGPNCSAAVVPRAALDRQYGRYIEQWRVSRPTRGYKSAHQLAPTGDPGSASAGYEADFPEGEWDISVGGFVHGPGGQLVLSYNSGQPWTAWRTTEIRWWPGHLQYWLDGRLAISASGSSVPDGRMDWIIQNESALNGEQAAPGSWAQIDIRYAAYFAYAGSA